MLAETSSPPDSAFRTLQSIGLWLVGNALLLVAVAWVAFQLEQQGLTAVLLLAIFVGLALGAGGAWIARHSGMRSLKLALAGAVAWSLLAVLAQDYFGFLLEQRKIEQYQLRSPLAVAFLSDIAETRTFPDFVLGHTRSLWWVLDALVTVGMTVLVTAGGLAAPPRPNGENSALANGAA